MLTNKTPMIITRPGDQDFWERVMMLNHLHPLAVPEHWRAAINVRCGPGLQDKKPSLGTLKRVVFKSGAQKMFQNIKQRPRYSDDRGPELIDCDGNRLNVEAIERIEIELELYDPLNWRQNGEVVHSANHNSMLALYNDAGEFVGWQCVCGYRYGKE